MDRLIVRLRSDDEAVRIDAACGLGRFGDAAKRAAPALAAVLQRQVLDTVPEARPLRPAAPPPDDTPLTSCEEEERDARERWYGRRVEKAGSPRDLQREWERDSWDREHGRIVWAIRRLEGGEVAARALLDLFRREPELRCDYRTVEMLLASLGPTALPSLDEGLHDEITQVRYFAAWAIAHLRPLPDGAEKLLQRTIEWDQGDVRSAAVAGLDAVRSFRRGEKEREEREQRADAMRNRDWLSEFPSYPGATKVCSGLSWEDWARGGEIAFTLYASRDDPAVVASFYAEARRVKAERNARSLSVEGGQGAKRVTVVPASRSHADCGAPLPSGARTVLVVSETTPLLVPERVSGPDLK